MSVPKCSSHRNQDAKYLCNTCGLLCSSTEEKNSHKGASITPAFYKLFAAYSKASSLCFALLHCRSLKDGMHHPHSIHKFNSAFPNTILEIKCYISSQYTSEIKSRIFQFFDKQIININTQLNTYKKAIQKVIQKHFAKNKSVIIDIIIKEVNLQSVETYEHDIASIDFALSRLFALKFLRTSPVFDKTRYSKFQASFIQSANSLITKDYTRAIAHCRAALSQYTMGPEYADSKFLLAFCEHINGRYDAALSLFNEAFIFYCKEKICVPEISMTKYFIGTSKMLMGQFNESFKDYTELIDYSNKINSANLLTSNIYYNIGLLLFSKRNYKKAMKCFSNTLTIRSALCNGDRNALVDVYCVICCLKQDAKQYEIAVQYGNKATKMLEMNLMKKNSMFRADFDYSFGLALLEAGDQRRSFNCLLNSIQIKLSLGLSVEDKKLLAESYMKIADRFTTLNNINSSIAFHKEIMRCYLAIYDSKNVIIANHQRRIALLCDKIGSIADALFYYHSCANSYAALKDANEMRNAYENLLRLSKTNIANYKEYTKEYYKSCCDVLSRSHSHSLKISTLLNEVEHMQ